MLYDNLEKGQQYILKCKEKDLTHNLREFYKHNTELPISQSCNIFGNGQYFYMMFIQGNDDLDLQGEILK